MNNYTDYKVFIFGQWIKDGHNEIMPYMGSWSELLKSQDFSDFRKKHEITDKQLAIIKRGFHGWPLEAPETDQIVPFPFGLHKGKPFDEVPNEYYAFILGQDWIGKWPEVQRYAEQVVKEMNVNAASKEDIKTILSKIN